MSVSFIHVSYSHEFMSVDLIHSCQSISCIHFNRSHLLMTVKSHSFTSVNLVHSCQSMSFIHIRISEFHSFMSVNIFHSFPLISFIWLIDIQFQLVAFWFLRYSRVSFESKGKRRRRQHGNFLEVSLITFLSKYNSNGQHIDAGPITPNAQW